MVAVKGRTSRLVPEIDRAAHRRRPRLRRRRRPRLGARPPGRQCACRALQAARRDPAHRGLRPRRRSRPPAHGAATVSMFGGARVVRTSTSRKINAQFLKPLLEPGAMTGTLVVEAGGLRARRRAAQAVRGLEHRRGRAVLSRRGARHRRAWSSETLAEAKHRDRAGCAPAAGQPARRRPRADAGRDRQAAALCARHGRRSRSRTSRRSSATPPRWRSTRILLAASGGNGRKAIMELDRAVASGESPQGIIVMTLRHFQRLHRLRAAMDQGRSFEDAARSMRPPLHFKSRGRDRGASRAWDGPRLDRAIAVDLADRQGRAPVERARGDD